MNGHIRRKTRIENWCHIMCALYANLILYTFFETAMLKRNLDYLYVIFFNLILCSCILFLGSTSGKCSLFLWQIHGNPNITSPLGWGETKPDKINLTRSMEVQSTSCRMTNQSVNQSIQKTSQHGRLFDCRSHNRHAATTTTRIQTLFVHPTNQISVIAIIILCEK
jgi:hypothetical protein